MKAFRLLVGFRLREIAVTPRIAITYFGLPVVLVLVTGAMFSQGHPFERRTLCLVGDDAAITHARATLSRFEDLRLETAPTLAIATARLRVRAVHAVLALGSSMRLWVGPRDELLGRGLVHALARDPRAGGEPREAVQSGSEQRGSGGLLFAPVDNVASMGNRLLGEPSAGQTALGTGGASLQIAQVPAGAYVHYLFPGLLVWNIVFVGLLTMGYRIARYRRTHFLKKLGTTPLHKATFVGAQITSTSLLVLVQMGLMTLASALAFSLPLSAAAVGWLAVLTLVGLLVFVAGGFALASIVRNEVVLQDVAGAVAVAVILLSEVFFPAQDLPGPVAALSEALPSTQLVRLMRHALASGELGEAALWPALGIIGAWLLGAFLVSLLTFRWND